jgi:allantoate deiminase
MAALWSYNQFLSIPNGKRFTDREMMNNKNNLRINANRFLTDFAELGSIGATPEGGANRPSFSDAHILTLAWFRRYTEQAGLTFHCDQAGNFSARLSCGRADAPTLMIGSHLDSVYNGGRFDGALGVMSGLEALQSIKDAALRLPFNLEVIAFTDEEGTLVGMLGSKAVTGIYHAGLLEQGTVSKDIILAALEKGGIDAEQIGAARRDPHSIFGYLELHIEQGPRLQRQGCQIGVVTGIVGMCALRITYTGKANHAGTTGMHDRQDAGLGASSYNLAAHQMVLERFPGCVVTIGQMQYKPGGINIVPAQAIFSVDYRSIDPVQLNELEHALIELAGQQASAYHLTAQVEKTLRHEPALMDETFLQAIEKGANTLGLSNIRMPSGAGHDAQNMASICPSGMLFVPSQDGISHSPFERSSDADCVNGANVVLQAVLNLAANPQ